MTDHESPVPVDPKNGGDFRRIVALLVLVLAIPFFAFGRAIINGDYFGECDHAAHHECDITHVLGIVMRRDVPRPETETASTAPETTTTSAAATPTSNNYTSPCTLYVRGHNAMLEISGSEAGQDCERFVAATQTPWTTETQETTESRTVVCEVTNNNGEHAIVTDTGGHAYGSKACDQLSGEGWG